MGRYVKLRRFSERGSKISGYGVLAIVIACAVPIGQPWPTLAILIWMATGGFVLAKSISTLELQTFKGLLKWGGLCAAWPVVQRAGSAIMEQSDEWLKPPTTTANDPK